MAKLEKILNIQKDDLRRGKVYLEFEQVNPVTSDSIFLTFLYSVIAQREHFTNLQRRVRSLDKAGIITPENVLTNREEFREILNAWDSKYIGCIKLAEWFTESPLISEITEDTLNGRSRGFELRNKIAVEAPRVSYKSASLALMKFGYNEIAPVDIHAMNFLYAYLKSKGPVSPEWNFLIRATKKTKGNKKIRGGIRSSKDYLLAEQLLLDASREYDTTPSILQSTVYLRGASSKELLRFKNDQIEFISP